MRRALGLLVLSVPLLAACSSSGDSGGCNTSYDCASGQTCWSTDGTSFSCVPSGPGPLGARCDATVTGVRTVSCSDAEICLATGDPTNASCTAWCGGGRACPSGTTCRTVTTTLHATLVVCL